MTDSALFKLGRAKRRIDDLSKSLAASSPFRYVLTSDWTTGMRYLHTVGDADEVAEMSLTIGEVLQALGSALDHAYWEIVSPTAKDAKEQKRIQFPFGATAERLEEQFKPKLATRVSAEFVEALRALKPFAGEDGNRDLYMLHEFNNADKHRELTPVGDTKIVDADALKKMHHDFPAWLSGTYRTMFNGKDASWRFGPALGAAGRIEHTDLGVKVDPLLRIGQYQYMPPAVFLNNLHRAATDAIEKMRAAV